MRFSQLFVHIDIHNNKNVDGVYDTLWPASIGIPFICTQEKPQFSTCTNDFCTKSHNNKNVDGVYDMLWPA